MDYRDKIRKLLKLADNPNENEARAALLKARELMAEHKLTEAECAEAAKQAVRKVLTKWTATTRRDPWTIELSAVIAEHYCCVAFREKNHGGKTNTVGFVGLEEDVGVCVEVFDFAMKIVRSTTEAVRKKYRGQTGMADSVRQVCDSYGYGFATGVYRAFQVQKRRHSQEWGLVLAVPAEVKEATAAFGNKDFNTAAEPKASEAAFNEGYREGLKFDPAHTLKEA